MTTEGECERGSERSEDRSEQEPSMTTEGERERGPERAGAEHD